MYQQLTPKKRYMLYAFKQEGCSMREIGVHYSTVSRELRRNHSKRGNLPGRGFEHRHVVVAWDVIGNAVAGSERESTTIR